MSKKLIYKYLPFSINSLKILIKGELWFGLPKNLNDPFEGEFTTKEYSHLPSAGLIEFFYEQNKELLNVRAIKDKIDKIKTDNSEFHKDVYFILKKRLKEHYGLSSFSYIPNSILMWSHYANAHKGFCIAFDKGQLLETLKYPWKDFYNVDYKPNLFEAELILKKNKIAYRHEKEILYRKLNIWRREKEARIIAIFKNSDSQRNLGFDKSCIKRIIFGENIAKDDKNTLKTLIENDSKYSNLEFYTAIKNMSKQKMKIENLNFK